jgi:hypothetical protein
VRDAAGWRGREDLIRDFNVVLQPDAAPVFGQLNVAPLNGEWSVVVRTIAREQ